MTTMMSLMTYIILVLILRDEPFSYIGLAGLILGIIGIVLVVGVHEAMAGGVDYNGRALHRLGFCIFCH